MALTPEQLHEIGIAIATVEAAITNEPEAFRYLDDHAHVVGDAVVMALAQRGFVVAADPIGAAIVLNEIEREAGIEEPKILS
jgi:hypothetical protein